MDGSKGFALRQVQGERENAYFWSNPPCAVVTSTTKDENGLICVTLSLPVSDKGSLAPAGRDSSPAAQNDIFVGMAFMYSVTGHS
jgi:hypothetical protein